MSIDKNKCDVTTGNKVKAHLEKLNIETPIKDTVNTSNDEKILRITEYFREIMHTLCLDLKNDSLQDTPSRVAKMFVNDLFYGLDYNNFPKCTTVANDMGYNEMVLEKDINVKSTCEHHFIVIDGFATVAYIPKTKVIGLSKLGRIVDFFSHRPQIQERLTEQIYHSLSFILETEDVAVVIDADHYCIKSRGLGDDRSRTVTSKLGGVFKNDPATRSEFMSFVNKRD